MSRNPFAFVDRLPWVYLAQFHDSDELLTGRFGNV